MASKSAWTLASLAALAMIQTAHCALADEAGCLVVGAWDEARGEPAPVIEAVVSTIVNRARARGLSVCDAVMDPAALSGVTPAMHELFAEAARPRDELTPQPHTRTDRAQLAVVAAAAMKAVAGTLPDRSNGATHFYSPTGMRELGLTDQPSWAASMVQTAKIGPFVFLREKVQSPALPVAFSASLAPQRRNSAKPVESVAPVPVPVSDRSDPQLPPFDPGAGVAPPPFAPVQHAAGQATPRPSRSDPIFALAPPPYVAPQHSASATALAKPASPQTVPASDTVLAVPPIPVEQAALPPPSAAPQQNVTAAASPKPEAPQTSSVPAPVTASATSSAPAEQAAQPVTTPVMPGQDSAGPAVAAAAENDGLAEWVAPPSPFDPTAPRQVIRSAAAESPVQHAVVASAAVKSVTVPLNPLPLASVALTPVRTLPFSPPRLSQPVEMATVVLDRPRFLELPGTAPHFAIVAEASAAELPAQSQDSPPDAQASEGPVAGDGADPQAQASAGEAESPAGVTEPSAPETGRPAEPEMEAPPTPLIGRSDAQPEPQERVAEIDSQYGGAGQQAEPPPAYAPPVYNRPTYAGPAYPTNPAYAPPPYAGPQGNYWAPQAAPVVRYWQYRPAAGMGCPPENRRVAMVPQQWQWGRPRFVRRTVCVM